jgi:hypothetical protein
MHGIAPGASKEMSGWDAAGLSSFEARPALQDEHLSMTVNDLSALQPTAAAAPAAASASYPRD